MDPTTVKDAISAALGVLAHTRGQFVAALPDDTTHQQFYTPRAWRRDLPAGSNYGWTTGFWPGLLWLADDLDPQAGYRDQALGWVDSFTRRLSERVDIETHDLGFLYSLACVAAYLRAGSSLGRDTALAAADALLVRFREPAGVIQAWGSLDDPDEAGRTIVDSLMNLPLLFWASQVSGQPQYARAAVRHAQRVAEHFVRADGSTYHTFFFDPHTGAPRFGRTAQGAGDHSCWARGQAWAIYGFALAHRYTGEPGFAQAARCVAEAFLARLPEDLVPYWDLTFTAVDGEERDSSAAAIACCGFLELGGGYRPAAERILEALIAGYAVRDPAQSTALLRHAVYSKPHGRGVDEGCLWGDYFYLEALTRLVQPGWVSFW